MWPVWNLDTSVKVKLYRQGVPVRIGELSSRSGISARRIRYYEEQGLLEPERDANGYRRYSERSVRLTVQIRELIDAGMTTQIIREILPCVEDQDAAATSHLSDGILQQLREHQSKIAELIECLSETHDAIDNYIANARDGQRGHEHGTPPVRCATEKTTLFS